MILQAIMKEKRRSDRQEKRLEYNVNKLSGMDFARTPWQLKTGNGGKGLLGNHLHCPVVEQNRTE